jgi:aminoglycoside phosphotransferase family enzyme/predicted kinase
VHETHASWVFVTGVRAYKVKKPLALGFLDYSTLALRHAACREEVRVNGELAPGIYLGVRAIVRTATGFALVSEDAPEAVEYAVEMRRFREADTLAGLIAADAMTAEHVRAVARRLAAFHRAAAVIAGGTPSEVLGMWRENARGLAELGDGLGWRTREVESFGEAFVQAHAAEIERRRRAGLVRDGHGDLRCEHILVTSTVRVVDRVEFDPALRHTDVACDLAFLAMDLELRGQRWAAGELISAYRGERMDPGSEALECFYAAHRALVRAKVALIAADEHRGDARAGQLREAHACWNLGERLRWRARAPLAVVICGPAASGKSTLADGLARRSGMTVISSDAVRKSIGGLEASERGAPALYGERSTQATYERLGDDARLALEHERAVIVDATCRSRASRALLLDRLRGAAVTLLMVRCEAPVDVARERAARRLRDSERISDATPEIVAEHYRSFEPLDELDARNVLHLDTRQGAEEQLDQVAAAADRLLVAAGEEA